jgi:hypothetical protein
MFFTEKTLTETDYFTFVIGAVAQALSKKSSAKSLLKLAC